MKWTRSELRQADEGHIAFDEDVVIDSAAFAGNSRINSVKNVHVDGQGFLEDGTERFFADMHVTGVMLVPDAVTGEEIEYPFETESEEIYAFEETDEDGVRIVTGEVVELMPAVVDAILLEVPLQVTNASEEDYPQGDGWRVITEEAYQRSQEERLDPRLAKLKEFKEEK
ncbi:MAG: DUF177 domain-containing protein [Solobacterium sp.]|nr:DUF177 domain-containing protein [Solobacterium sp.]